MSKVNLQPHEYELKQDLARYVPKGTNKAFRLLLVGVGYIKNGSKGVWGRKGDATNSLGRIFKWGFCRRNNVSTRDVSKYLIDNGIVVVEEAGCETNGVVQNQDDGRWYVVGNAERDDFETWRIESRCGAKLSVVDFATREIELKNLRFQTWSK